MENTIASSRTDPNCFNTASKNGSSFHVLGEDGPGDRIDPLLTTVVASDGVITCEESLNVCEDSTIGNKIY